MIFERQECGLSLSGSSGSQPPTKLHRYKLQAGQTGFQAHSWCWQDSIPDGRLDRGPPFLAAVGQRLPSVPWQMGLSVGHSRQGSWLPSEWVSEWAESERARRGKSDGSQSLFVTCSQKGHSIVCWILFIRVKWLHPACAQGEITLGHGFKKAGTTGGSIRSCLLHGVSIAFWNWPQKGSLGAKVLFVTVRYQIRNWMMSWSKWL